VLLSGDGHIVDVRGNEIVLGFDNPNLARTFREGFNAEPLAEAVTEVLGGKWRITVGTGAGPGGGAGPRGSGGSSGGAPVWAVRLTFVGLVLAAGFGLVVYLLLWLLWRRTRNPFCS